MWRRVKITILSVPSSSLSLQAIVLFWTKSFDVSLLRLDRSVSHGNKHQSNFTFQVQGHQPSEARLSRICSVFGRFIQDAVGRAASLRKSLHPRWVWLCFDLRKTLHRVLDLNCAGGPCGFDASRPTKPSLGVSLGSRTEMPPGIIYILPGDDGHGHTTSPTPTLALQPRNALVFIFNALLSHPL
ncbi:hypothetical protein SCHPADRAFT_670219 [Schizopora paradoxa]|uniref:Uncharacterized protein n=1 Tax=Schizopora paradoxa TaxID=27342 RepID=A0A0H2R6K6_9AGAM|nr:hypothetical protein SCHPADRAFT_670219 [Schizopora paradoxa]